MRDTVVVIGVTGRLGPDVIQTITAQGRSVVQVARSRAATVNVGEVDVRDTAWHSARRWQDALCGAGFNPDDIAGAVSLVASRDRSARAAEVTSIAAVRTLAALAELPSQPACVHVGSVAEFRTGRPSAYAAGKRAARREARRLGIHAVLTLGVVPRPHGHPGDAGVRWLANRVPAVANLILDTSTPTEVGAALETMIGIDWHALAGRLPAEVTLIGTPQRLADIVGATPVSRWYTRPLLTTLTRVPCPRATQGARLLTLARAAAGPRPTYSDGPHYNTQPPTRKSHLVHSAGGWQLVAGTDDPGRWWLAPQSAA